MDPKTFRYMQRIERIIGTPHRATSPIRPSKSPLICKTNRLDRYLKFELAAKISASIIHKNHKELTALFFNTIRNCDPQQRERIYKFIPIEKKEDAIIMKVDLNIAVRLFRTVMMQLLENRMGKCFEVLKKYEEEEESQSNKFQRIQIPAFKSMSKIPSKNGQESLKRKISEWNDAVPTSIINENLKIQKKNFKQYVLRNINKIIRRNILKRKEKGIQLIKLAAKQRKMVQVRKDCQIYEKEVAKRISEIEIEEQIKIDKEEKYMKQIRAWEQKLLKYSVNLKSTKYDSKIIQIPEESQEYKINNDDLLRLINSYHHKFKANFIKYIKNGLKSTHFINRQEKQIKCFNLLHRASIISLKRNILSFRAIKEFGFSQLRKKERAFKLCNLLLKIKNIKISTFSHYFFSQITKKSSQAKEKSHFLNLEKNKYDHILTKSEATKIQTPRTIQNDRESYTPMSKVNFYIFIQKMTRFILIISKMLVPLKQSFVAIDQYASSVFKIEQAFKRLNYRYKELCFKKMKTYTPLKKSRGKERNKALNNIFNILQLDVKERYIEAFSRLKIMTSQDHFKIQVKPIKCNFVVETRKFIAERQEANKKNEQTWNQLLQEINSAN